MEEKEQAALAGLQRGLDDGAPVAEVARRFWRRLTGPARLSQERLWFEMCGQALQGRPGTTHLLDRMVEGWLAPLMELSRRAGLPPEKARTNARRRAPGHTRE
ncbi:hypothetical protein [Nonomuraea sp. NPDC049400]|uniref:hypothetical protein n=1 Tax=Nonomuraea sp. NPDC049400 TaxID=3364352 RepID=UPI0037935AD4